MVIAELAERQYGVVSRRQLIAAGFRPSAIDRRIAQGRLHVLQRGVYAVGHPVLTRRGVLVAGVLAGGGRAALSHRSATELWELPGPRSAVVEITVPHRRSTRPGLLVHEGALQADETTVHDGIPVTTVARTLLDLAAVVSPGRLAAMVNEAERRRLADSPSLPELLERHRGARGIAALRSILADRRTGVDVTRRELEARFLEFVHERDLPHPELNPTLDVDGRRFEPDCLWRSSRLIVELDSHAYHSGRSEFEGDRARDRALLVAGLITIRVTWRQLHDEPDRLDRDLRAVLERRDAAGATRACGRSPGAGSRSCLRRSG